MQLHHICIQTDNYAESLEFYTKVLNFKVIKESPNFHTRAYNSWLKLDSLRLELQTGKAKQELQAYQKVNKGLAHLCFLVADLEGKYQEFKSRGFTNFKPKQGRDIYDVEGSKLLKIIAPEGTIIEFRDLENI